MEAFQESYVRAVIAASGAVLGVPGIDEGVDLTLTHRADVHGDDGVARLEIQLKSTADASNIKDAHVSASMSAARYNYFRTPNPTIPKIVVILALPSVVDDWLLASHDELLIRHCCYWVNLAGEPAISTASTTVHAPRANIFDDHALCAMMERVGQGGAP